MAVELRWNPLYSVGNDTLDEQHKKLLKLCVEATICMESSATIEEFERFHAILTQMISYAAEHFETEEALLKEHGYPQLAEHQEEHQEYIGQLTELLMRASEDITDRGALKQCLWTWWSRHILESDMKYSEFIWKNNERG
ncbi:MAG: bacteriohemerythrin [Proteobacteria bacterium]|nr:bacteriohemerythrin [Pseudomonadota bacterium]